MPAITYSKQRAVIQKKKKTDIYKNVRNFRVMKIFNAEQIHAWDEYTIREEPISSIALMERAAEACTRWISSQFESSKKFSVYCGKGNNGGDGLAIARLLTEKGYTVSVYILEFGFKGTPDFQTNLAKLHSYPGIQIHFIQSEENIHPIQSNHVVLDALFGSGLNRPLSDLTASLVAVINNSGEKVISIDIPSGLFTNKSSIGNSIVKANYTLTFQSVKLAFLMPENNHLIGKLEVLDIGLHPGYLSENSSEFEFVDSSIVKSIYKPRNSFSHKGNFGHALIIAGSYGKIGAAILSAKACIKAGAGLLTIRTPKSGFISLHSAIPEAMLSIDESDTEITDLPATVHNYNAVGIGPGIGQSLATKKALLQLLQLSPQKLVLDADALNIIAADTSFMPLIPKGAVITPHVKEFERLFGHTRDNFEQIELALKKATEFEIYIVLKGHHSFIACPDGKGYFNSTGNAGMATAGSGDVLTGIITALLSQGYKSQDACILGVYLHGLSGDISSELSSMEALIASDIIDNLGLAFKKIQTLA